MNRWFKKGSTSGGGGVDPNSHTHANKGALDRLGVNGNNKLTIDGIEQTGGGGGTAPVTNKWEGKKANFMGDSITAGFGTTPYHVHLKTMLGFATCRNYGTNSSTVCDRESPMHQRVTTMDTDADIVFVLGGTNDWGWTNSQLGTNYTLGANGLMVPSTDTNTFYGAYHRMCQNLLARYPSKKIVLMTPLHRSGTTQYPEDDLSPNSVTGKYLYEFVNAVKEVGAFYSIPVLDLYATSGLLPRNAEQRALYFSETDALHPNIEGHKRLAAVIADFIS